MSEETLEEVAARMGLDMNKLTEKKEPAEEVKEDKRPLTVLERLRKFPNAPEAGDVEMWRTRHAELLCFSPSEDEMYVFRPLNRLEWKSLKTKLANVEEDHLHEFIVGKCVLWPNLDSTKIAASRAGLAKTLYNLIMVGSYFLPDEIAMSMVEKL